MDIEDLKAQSKARGDARARPRSPMTISEREQYVNQSSQAYAHSAMKCHDKSELRSVHSQSLHVWLAYSLWKTVTRLLPIDETNQKTLNQGKAERHFRIRRSFFAFRTWLGNQAAAKSCLESSEEVSEDERTQARKRGEIYKLPREFKPKPVLMPKRHIAGKQEAFCAIPGLCECSRM